MKTILLIVAFLLLEIMDCFAQPRFNVYYISIGSMFYKNNPGATSWDDLPEAGTSATIMASCLSRYAGGKGLTFISKKNELFSKDILNDALKQLWNTILQERPVNPLLVVYYCGHGISDTLVGSQYLPSGDCSTLQKTETFQEMCRKNVFIPEITKMLSDLSLAERGRMVIPRYLFLLDCCRHDTSDPNMRIVTDTSDRTSITKYKNPDRTAELVVYSTMDRKEGPVMPLPVLQNPIVSGKDTSGIGPLCRKTLILLDKRIGTNASGIDLESYVTELLDPSLDQPSGIPSTPYTTGRDDNALFLVAEQLPPPDSPAARISIADLRGKWTGIHYLGLRKPKFPAKLPAYYKTAWFFDSTNYVLNIDTILGNKFYGTIYEYFDQDSSINHYRSHVEGTISDGKFQVVKVKPIERVLHKYTGYWIDRPLAGEFASSGDKYIAFGTTGFPNYFSGPYKLSKSKIRPPDAPAIAGADSLQNAFKIRKADVTGSIEIENSHVVLKFFDDGTIDGDVISVFINGNLFLAHQKLTDHAIEVRLNIDSLGSNATITMVAENMGRIPPNTALMVVEDGEKRSELRLTSTFKSNSTIIIRKRKQNIQ